MSKTPQRNRRGEKGEEKKKGGREGGQRKKEEGKRKNGGGSDGKRSQKTHFTKNDPDDGFCFSIMAVH